jgi:hypothetical protein
MPVSVTSIGHQAATAIWISDSQTHTNSFLEQPNLRLWFLRSLLLRFVTLSFEEMLFIEGVSSRPDCVLSGPRRRGGFAGKWVALNAS